MTEVKVGDVVSVTAWSCPDCQKPLEKISYDINLKDLGPDQVLVKVEYCGVCASDVHIVKAPYKMPIYPFPLIAGHEGVGTVMAQGSLAEKTGKLKVGDRVGLGIYRHVCGDCEYCLSGDDNLCAKKMLMFAFGNKGAFASHMIIDSKFAFKIPDEIKTEEAGPLMCAGLTTFSPFRVHNVRPGDSVGVIGIGGLGHLSIQIARKWGCKVYAFSSGSEKEKLAKDLGAHVYVDTSKKDAFAAIGKAVNIMMVTAPGAMPWKELLGTLKPKGKIILMGMSADALPYTATDLVIGGSLSVHGSAGGSSADANALLKFAAVHGIRPMVEVSPIGEINDVMEKVLKNKVRFRGVVKHVHD